MLPKCYEFYGRIKSQTQIIVINGLFVVPYLGSNVKS